MELERRLSISLAVMFTRAALLLFSQVSGAAVRDLTVNDLFMPPRLMLSTVYSGPANGFLAYDEATGRFYIEDSESNNTMMYLESYNMSTMEYNIVIGRYALNNGRLATADLHVLDESILPRWSVDEITTEIKPQNTSFREAAKFILSRCGTWFRAHYNNEGSRLHMWLLAITKSRVFLVPNDHSCTYYEGLLNLFRNPNAEFLLHNVPV